MGIFCGQDLAHLDLLIRTLWHSLRWDDLIQKPSLNDIGSEDMFSSNCIFDANGQPLHRELLDADGIRKFLNKFHRNADGNRGDSDEDYHGDRSNERFEPCSVRRIVEIQPLVSVSMFF